MKTKGSIDTIKRCWGDDSLEEKLPFEVGQYIEDEKSYFEVGDLVMVREIIPEMENVMSPEDYYYLLGFSKKKGFITDIKCHPVTNIYVDFGGNIGIFYEKDIKRI